MFRSDPSLLYAAITSLSSAFDSLNEADGMSSSLTSFPPDYPFSGEVNAILSDVKSAKADVSSLNRKISETKDRLCSLDTAFSLTYYACAAQKYESLDSLTDEQQAYLEYNQKQYYEQLYKYLDENKDNLTAEQKQIYEALKEKKVIEKKYEELQKLYKEKKENNGLLHPIIEGNINDEIKALEKELGIYQNKWYEDIGYAITKTGSEWGEGFSSLFAGEGFGELWDAAKQTVATGAVVCRSAESGVAKIGEWVVDGVAAVGGTIAAGATWLFHDTWSDNDVAGKVMDSTLDFVRRDLIGESNKNFYENTSVGQWINNNSNLKYDSAGAQTISTATRIAAEIVIATAAEVCTLGAATPLVIAMFAAEGVGQATESYVQSVNREDGDSYNYGKVLLTEALGGIGGAMKGRMYGKIGANCLQILENPSLITQGLNSLKDTGLKNLIKKDVTSGAFKVDAGMTFGQKVYEGYVEYNNTGDINWGKLGLSFLNELAISRITDNMMAMNLSGKLDIDNVKVLSSNVDYAEIQDAFDIMRYKFGDKEALFRIREALQTGNFNLITRDGNARMIFSTLSSTDFDNFLSSNFSKSASLKSMSDFYESLGNSYGQDQGAIKNLCDYYYNGQKVNYNQATSLVNDFVSK